ncbi:hypothetical protein EJ08DRAFT_108612 [Tothia fuscella]|uniref:Uncharacterized protein n=1 Tax=Tothia fuscella TaxID=1048955 RepID=A0A9P4TZN2_9PEZI|nr:hypothetical protein EJ08DRAFT_108612 [Tothia fuscella]
MHNMPGRSSMHGDDRDRYSYNSAMPNDMYGVPPPPPHGHMNSSFSHSHDSLPCGGGPDYFSMPHMGRSYSYSAGMRPGSPLPRSPQYGFGPPSCEATSFRPSNFSVTNLGPSDFGSSNHGPPTLGPPAFGSSSYGLSNYGRSGSYMGQESHYNSEGEVEDYVRKTNLSVQIANSHITPQSQYAQLQPKVCWSGRCPDAFRNAKTIEQISCLGSTAIDDILSSYQLPTDLRAFKLTSSREVTPRVAKQAKLCTLYDFLGAVQLAIYERCAFRAWKKKALLEY